MPGGLSPTNYSPMAGYVLLGGASPIPSCGLKSCIRNPIHTRTKGNACIMYGSRVTCNSQFEEEFIEFKDQRTCKVNGESLVLTIYFWYSFLLGDMGIKTIKPAHT